MAEPFASSGVPDQTGVEDQVANLVVDLTAVVGGMPLFGDPDSSNGDTLTYTAVLDTMNSANPNVVTVSVLGSLITLDPQDNQNGTAIVLVTAKDPSAFFTSLTCEPFSSILPD